MLVEPTMDDRPTGTSFVVPLTTPRMRTTRCCHCPCRHHQWASTSSSSSSSSSMGVDNIVVHHSSSPSVRGRRDAIAVVIVICRSSFLIPTCMPMTWCHCRCRRHHQRALTSSSFIVPHPHLYADNVMPSPLSSSMSLSFVVPHPHPHPSPPFYFDFLYPLYFPSSSGQAQQIAAVKQSGGFFVTPLPPILYICHEPPIKHVMLWLLSISHTSFVANQQYSLTTSKKIQFGGSVS